MKKLISALDERSIIYDKTNKLLEVEGPLKVYLGFDPTGNSLHVGHLVGILSLKWFQNFDHEVIALIGGATGMIGDPSGKNKERALLDSSILENNVAKISSGLTRLLGNSISLVNNYEWFSRFSCLEFLRDVGKYFRVGSMINKESVKQRLQSEEGISFTEFSYQLLQSYDFLHLFESRGVSLQLGGSDQWGNITAGIDFVRKKKEQDVYGLTFPLLVDSEGKKMGKTEAGTTVWLDEAKMSVYDFYQYFYRLPDHEMSRMLCILTFLDVKEINRLVASMQHSEYVPGSVQNVLASEVTRFVHGDQGVEKARKITLHLSPGNMTELSKESLEFFKKEKLSLPMKKIDVIGKFVVEIVCNIGLCQTKSESRRLISQKGLYVNNKPVLNDKEVIKEQDLIEKEYLVISLGKKKKIIINAII